MFTTQNVKESQTVPEKTINKKRFFHPNLPPDHLPFTLWQGVMVEMIVIHRNVYRKRNLDCLHRPFWMFCYFLKYRGHGIQRQHIGQHSRHWALFRFISPNVTNTYRRRLWEPNRETVRNWLPPGGMSDIWMRFPCNYLSIAAFSPVNSGYANSAWYSRGSVDFAVQDRVISIDISKQESGGRISWTVVLPTLCSCQTRKILRRRRFLNAKTRRKSFWGKNRNIHLDGRTARIAAW